MKKLETLNKEKFALGKEKMGSLHGGGWDTSYKHYWTGHTSGGSTMDQEYYDTCYVY